TETLDRAAPSIRRPTKRHRQLRLSLSSTPARAVVHPLYDYRPSSPLRSRRSRFSWHVLAVGGANRPPFPAPAHGREGSYEHAVQTSHRAAPRALPDPPLAQPIGWLDLPP